LGAFKRFGPGDQVDNVLILEPEWTLVSGSSGWRGSPEGSASVSLFEGRHRATNNVTREYRYQRTIPGTDSYGPLVRTGPITASVHFVYMTSDERQILTQRSNERWGYEHWKTVMGLYDYYERRSPDYVTSSYNYYCLYFERDSDNIVQFQCPYTDDAVMTASFTIESWVKPFQTSSIIQDFTIASMNRIFWFGITGSTGQLILSTSAGTHISDVGPTLGQWSHVSVRYNRTTQKGFFTVNLNDDGEFSMLSALPNLAGMYQPLLTVGNQNNGAIFTEGLGTGGGQSRRSFHGFIGETRLWHLYRTDVQLSSSMSISLTGSALAHSGSILCARFTDGPLALFPTDAAADAPTLMGSGTVDASSMYHLRNSTSGRYPWGWLMQFDDRAGPSWHPNDNVDFTPAKEFAGPPVCDPVAMATLGATTSGSGYDPVKRMLVLSVPSGMYGRQIVPNSVSITDRSFLSGSFGLIRTLIDDGRGGLFLSGTAGPTLLQPTPTAATADVYGSFTLTSVAEGSYANGITVSIQPAAFDGPAVIFDFPSSIVIQVNTEIDAVTDTTLGDLINLINGGSDQVTATLTGGTLSDPAPQGSFTLSGGTDGIITGVSRLENYRGVEWNKVGNVFYDEGLIIIKDPALLDFGAPWTAAAIEPSDLLQFSFRGSSHIPVKTMMCRIDRGDLNASLNKTFWEEEEDGDRVRRHPSGSMYVTTVGIYNSDRELVGVARLAEPLRVRPRDRMNVKLRLDF
jgi:hypothetical protein